jgi:predicted ArsR family transcriptional regulator
MSFDKAQSLPGPRQVTDPKALRALAHPLRLELLERLAVAGTLTSAAAAKLVGETPANCSFHFRTLAKYGFVEPAPAGRGRAQPWRRVPGGIGTAEVHEDADTSLSARALTDMIVDRHLETIRSYRSTRQETLPSQWRQLSGHINLVSHLTVDELRELRADLVAVLTRFAERDASPSSRPPGTRPVQVFAFAMPGPPAADADTGATAES